MTRVCQKSICIYQDCRIKGFMFTIKEVWDQVCSPENQFFNISSCKWPSTFSLKSFTWCWRGIDELLIFLSHQHVQHMTSQILLILIDFDRVFDHLLIWNNSSSNRYNSGTRRGIRELKQPDSAAVNKYISIQKDSRPSEFTRPLIPFTLELNGDLNVTASSRPPRQFA